MSEEKKEVKVEEKVKNPDLSKQVANTAFTVRKIKNWLEEKMGADIDGDGRVGSGPYKKALAFLLIASLTFIGNVKADYKSNVANWYGTEASPITYIDSSGNIVAPSITVNNFTVNTNVTISGNATVSGAITGGTATVTGKSTLNGELEVNNSDVDINMTLSENEIDIAQTNTTGQASTPWININDDRTGATANEASEAAVYIDSDGAYGLAIVDGIVQIEAEIDTASGDILLDPAGSEVHIDGGLHVGGTDAIGDNNLKVDGTAEITGVATFTAESIHNAGIDADYITTDAGLGVDTKSAGMLAIGAATATSVEIADAGVETDIQGTLSVDQTAMFDAAVTAASVRVNGQLSLANGEYFINDQDTYMKCSGHLVSVGDGTFNLGSSTQQWNYLYLKNDIAAEDGTFRDGLTVNTNLTLPALTASKPVFTDGSKVLTSSGTLGADQGGTGVASPTDHAVLVGSGASAVTPITVGANGELLIGQTSADPAFKPASGDWTINEGGTNVIGSGKITSDKILDGAVSNVDIATGIDASKLAAGTTASAIDGSGITNIAGDNIASGNIAAARIATALGTSGGSIGGNIPIAAITNALSATLYSGTYTNLSTLSTNTITVLNGVIVSVTLNP